MRLLALSILASLGLAGCGADGQPIAPTGAAQPTPPPDAPIIGPDGNPVVLAGQAQPRSAATEPF